MKYEVVTRQFFSDKADADAAFADAKNHLAKAVSLNEGVDDPMYGEELASISLIKIYHDEDPIKPCEEIDGYEVKSGKVVKKTLAVIG